MTKNYNNVESFVNDKLIKNRFCNRCNSPVLKSLNLRYFAECFECSEDLYECETYLDENRKITKEEFDKLVENVNDFYRD